MNGWMNDAEIGHIKKKQFFFFFKSLFVFAQSTQWSHVERGQFT